MFKYLILFLTAIPFLLTGQIIETEDLEEVFNYITPNTIVFCDLDNTLIQSTQQFGSVEWEDDYRKKLIVSGESPENAKELAHNLWMTILPFVSMQLVDEKAPEILRKLKGKGTIVLGLTARPQKAAPHTLRQIDQLGIQFDKKFPKQAIFLKDIVSFEKGVLFSGIHNKKSATLIAFLKQLHLSPKKILLVDDKLSHLQDLENALTALNIEFVGIRFSKADDRLKDYDAQIAEIEWELSPTLITDKQARQILLSRKKVR